MAGLIPTLSELKKGSKADLAHVLAVLETDPTAAALMALLDEAWEEPHGHVIGITGPPGVGKSSLINALIKRWRAQGHTIGIIAVDPSSQLSGGALLGDRTRFDAAPDDGVFIRSMAARDQIGGLASLSAGAALLMRALYDRVIVETVGIGQSQTDVVDIADTVVVCVQPGSGDSLQFMKAGIMEIPQVVVVTKADLGAPAQRAFADVKGALGLSMAAAEGWSVRTLLISAANGSGLDNFDETISGHFTFLSLEGRLQARRRVQGEALLLRALQENFGRAGIRQAETLMRKYGKGSPFARASQIARELTVK